MTKFNTHHFPAGTVVKLSEDVRFSRDGDDLIRTVKDLACNGARSWVFHTGATKDLLGGTQINEAFNIDHVERIIKRGTGGMIFEDPYRRTRAKVRDDIAAMEFADGEYRPQRGFYKTASLEVVVVYELMKFGDPHQWHDQERIIQEMVKQSWCRRTQVGLWFSFHSVNKKRLRKWLRVNEPRFRANLDAAEKREDEINREYFERDMELDSQYETGDPADEYIELKEGRHYDDNDPAYQPELGVTYRMSEDDAPADADSNASDQSDASWNDSDGQGQ